MLSFSGYLIDVVAYILVSLVKNVEPTLFITFANYDQDPTMLYSEMVVREASNIIFIFIQKIANRYEVKSKSRHI